MPSDKLRWHLINIAAEDGALRASGTRLAPTEPEARPWTWVQGPFRIKRASASAETLFMRKMGLNPKALIYQHFSDIAPDLPRFGHIAIFTACIAVTLLSFITCVYRFNVILILLCPSISDSTL